MIARACARRWRLLGASVLLLVALGYGATYAAVSLASSPTDDSIILHDGRALASVTLQRVQDGSHRVVLVHGAPADAGSWGKLVRTQQDMLGDNELLAVDRLGYGNSGREAETSLAAHARSLDALIEPGTILVGHSYGGPVVLRAAVEYSDRLGGIVLVAGACDPHMHDSQWFRKLVDAAGVATPGPWHNANAELLALTDENNAMIELLDRVTCPVVIVHGTWDPVCPHDGTVEYLRGALVNAETVEVVSLPRAGHNLHLSHPDEVAAAIASLAGARDAASR